MFETTNESLKKSKRKLKKNLETNENKMIQNLWDSAKAVIRGKFTAIQAYFRKQENLKQPKETRKKKNKQNPKLVEGKKYKDQSRNK